MARSRGKAAAGGTLFGFRSFLRHRFREVFGVGLILAALAVILALFTYQPADPSLQTATGDPVRNALGRPGAYMADVFMQMLGLGSAAIPVPLAAWGFAIIRHDRYRLMTLRIAVWPLAALAMATVAACLPKLDSWPLASGMGGYLGDAMAHGTLVPVLGAIGITIPFFAQTIAAALAIPFALMGLGFAAGLKLEELMDEILAASRWLHGARDHASTLLARLPAMPALPFARVWSGPEDASLDVAARPRRRPRPRKEPQLEAAPDALKSPRVRREELAADKPKRKRAPRETQTTLNLEPEQFELPPLTLLAKPREGRRASELDDDRLEQNARLLENVLQDFGIRGEIIAVRPGPVVTLYELEPAPGIKSSRVIGLADDIARSMSAVSARVAVIPGRNVIGIELPNRHRETVFLRALLSTEDYERSAAKLALTLGKTIGGEPVIVDLATMPHLLIAGTTGSGKSVGINAMILSLLYRLRPEDCRLIMIDPKMLELSVYDGIPHLLAPVVTEPKKAVVALKWVVKEMEDRYRKMSKVGVRNIRGFNERVREAEETGETISRTVQTGFDRETGEPIYETEEMSLTPMPLIVVIVDEMADLMLVAGKDIEAAVQRLAQMARAAGIHLITATQRPSVDVITGTIKANFPTRISFQVTSKIDSRTILGEQGAEQLLGQGDMLYMAGGGRIRRVHGPFVSDGEVEEVVAFLKRQGVPDYLDAVTAGGDEDDGFQIPGEGGAGSGDALYDEAVAVVARDRKASTSYIQRKLQIGYNRAARIMERMEEEGVVSPANHAGKREVLLPDHGDFD